MSQTLMIARVELKQLLADPTPLVLIVAMPLVLLVFLANSIVGGPAQSVPGLAALFGFFGLSSIGIAFYRDHSWGVWDRYRASPVRPVEVVAGKAVPFALLFAVQLVVLLFSGWAFFDMPWQGHPVAAVAVVASVVLVEISLGVLVMAVCSTINQVMAVCYLGALALAGLGGALGPPSASPGWAQQLAPISPVYWALEAFGALIDPAQSSDSWLRPVLVLNLVSVVAVAVTLWRFRFDDTKRFFA